MNVKFSRDQATWLQKITETSTLQESVDFFLNCMKKEGIPASDILVLVDKMMKRGIALPPGSK